MAAADVRSCAPFDEAGLGVLADCVVGFEDVLLAVHENTGHFTNLDGLVKRVEQQDVALERRLPRNRRR